MGPARAAASAPGRHSRCRSRDGQANAGRLARKAKYLGAAINRVSSSAASGFDKGTLAMAHIGLTGAGRSQPDPPTSVRAIAPCQIPTLRPHDSSRAAPQEVRNLLMLKRQAPGAAEK